MIKAPVSPLFKLLQSLTRGLGRADKVQRWSSFSHGSDGSSGPRAPAQTTVTQSFVGWPHQCRGIAVETPMLWNRNRIYRKHASLFFFTFLSSESGTAHHLFSGWQWRRRALKAPFCRLLSAWESTSVSGKVRWRADILEISRDQGPAGETLWVPQYQKMADFLSADKDAFLTSPQPCFDQPQKNPNCRSEGSSAAGPGRLLKVDGKL